MSDKDAIRNNYLKLRLALPDLEYQQFSQNLCSIFFSSIDLSEIGTIHVYLPIRSRKEPNTWLIIDRIKKNFPHIRISIPKMEGNNKLVNYYFEGRNQIKENNWKIPEPQFGEITPTEKIDLVIVPLLSFDRNGDRVGYGKGYYDHFLKECRSDCGKVGLSFFEPVDEIPDIDKYDVKLTHCVTPKRFYSF